MPLFLAAVIGLQPVACAPWMVKGAFSINPSLVNSPYALWTLVKREPLAMQTTVCRGTLQPNCSIIS